MKKNNELPKMLYTVSEVAKVLLISRTSVYKLLANGEMKYIKVGCIKIPSTELEGFIQRKLESSDNSARLD